MGTERIPAFLPQAERIVRRVPLGDGRSVVFYDDDTVRFEHVCDRGDRGVIVCAPLLRRDGGHRIERDDLLTISPSILCPDCGTHGFVRDGSWVSA